MTIIDNYRSSKKNKKKYVTLFLKSNNTDNPVDTGRKLNVHKTFNLRPASTGNALQIKPTF